MSLAASIGSPAHAGCTRSVGPDGNSRSELKGGEAHDWASGLVWSRCSVGMTWVEGRGCAGERDAVPFAEAKAAAVEAAASTGRPWRLPTAPELHGLLDQDCGAPAIDTSVFPDVTAAGGEGAEEYWTATAAGINDMLATVEFSYGYGEIRSPGFLRRARLVRSGR